MVQMKNGHKITIVGTSYVGMSMGVLLAQHNAAIKLGCDVIIIKRMVLELNDLSDKVFTRD